MAVAENWEDLLDEIEEPAPTPSPSKSEGPSPCKSGGAHSSKARVSPSPSGFADEALSDPMAERLRRQRLIEENEKRLMDDLFAGCERPEAPAGSSPAAALDQKALIAAKAAKALSASSSDPVDAIQLKTFRDCERLAESLAKKILDSPAKSPAWLRLLDLLLKECSPKMELKDLKTLQTKLNATVQQRDKAEKLLEEKKKKPNSVASQCRNYREELDIVYGGDSEEDEEDEEDFI